MSPITFLGLFMIVPVALVAFSMMRRSVACFVVIFGAVMFAPERVAFDAPVVPPLDKMSLSTLMAAVGYFLIARRPRSGVEARIKLGKLTWGLGALLVLGSFATVLTNRDPLAIGGGSVLPALTPHDAMSGSVYWILRVVLPYALGALVMRSRDDAIALFKAMAVAGLIYSLFIVVELRLSPQFHVWVYGFRQHTWLQVLRSGGYRPMVFMPHGIALANFVVATALAALTLSAVKQRVLTLPSGFVALYLGILAIACKSSAAAVYLVVCGLFIRVFRPRSQMRLAMVLSVVVLFFPLMRTTDVFPTDWLVDKGSIINRERASSLQFRFDMEDRLLEKWKQRPLFGWGGYGRARVYDSRGENTTVTDGEWIIVLGAHGLAGFVGEFVLLLGPVLLTLARFRRIRSPPDRVMVAALALIVSFQTVDLLPNGLFTHLPLFLAGALWGLLQVTTGAASAHLASLKSEHSIDARLQGVSGARVSGAPGASGMQ